jgi:hypothetical protein
VYEPIRECMSMKHEQDQTDAFIEAAAKLLEIPLEPAWLPTIRENLEVTLAQARFVQSFELSDEAEPAFVFEA